MRLATKAEHERELVRVFHVPEVRPRYLSLLSAVRGRKKRELQRVNASAIRCYRAKWLKSSSTRFGEWGFADRPPLAALGEIRQNRSQICTLWPSVVRACTEVSGTQAFPKRLPWREPRSRG